MLQLTSLNVQTVLVALTVGLLVYYIRRRFIFRLPPGPWAIPLIGNYEVYSKPMMHRTLFDLSKKYGPVFQVHFGPASVVVLNSYEVVNEALVKRKSDFAGRPSLTTFELISEEFKDIAFATYSPMWRFHRRVATMALRNCLHGDLLEKLTEDNMRKVLDMMAAETGPFSLQSHLENIIYYQLFTLCFGEKKDIGDPDVVLLSSTKEVLNQNFGNGLMEDILPVLKDVYPSKRYLNIKEGLQKIHAFFYKNLEKHKDSFDPRNPRDLTDHLLLERSKAEEDGNVGTSEKLNDTYVVQTLSDVFYAGVDTTTMVLNWFTCFMSGLPHIQVQCQKEIDGNIGRRCPSINDRQVLPYTEACIYETMRRGVTVGLAQPHLTMCNTQVGGYDVPKDTAVLINLFAVHQDPKRWPEPDKFDPLRYLDEKGKTDPAKLENWLPFSTGIRVCLGKSLAQMEIFLICVHLLQRFQILLPGGVERNFEGKHSIFFGTEEPINLKVVVKERFK